MHTHYDSNEIRLANEIADALSDRDSLQYHLQNARKFKEEFQRKMLLKVMSIPENQIRKSRAALYTFLISQSTRNDDSRH